MVTAQVLVKDTATQTVANLVELRAQGVIRPVIKAVLIVVILIVQLVVNLYAQMHVVKVVDLTVTQWHV